MIRVENWCGYDTRFIDIDGEWWAILKDICDALNLKTWHVAERIPPDMLERVRIEVCDLGSKEVRSRARKTHDMLAVNELGIYEALFASRRLEARKFRMWAGTIMQKLRKDIGLKGYEVMHMTDPDIQNEINYMLDNIYWDDERGTLMRSVTVEGGDVEVVPVNWREK